ncbi:hypothetical protein ACCI51_19350 [Microbulbifer echini]|uniref:Uncharacterized protein n=1 Tax=Microbulbifer echini TaxID=1529067 RepID=A0ABV4NU17_9GAMM
MNLLLDHFACNPIIDELVYWPPRKILRVQFDIVGHGMEVEFEDEAVYTMPLSNRDISNWLDEALYLIATQTDIEVVFKNKKYNLLDTQDQTELKLEVERKKAELISSTLEKFKESPNDPYTRQWIAEQFGFNYRNLPAGVEHLLRRLREIT